MVGGQLPGLIAVEILLRAQVALKQLMRTYRRVDQQRPQRMPLGQVGRIVAAQGAADQHGPTELADQRVELGNSLTRMVMQGRYT